MGRKLGVVVVGVNGAVSSTLIAGCRLMAKNIVPRVGMITEKGNPAPGRQVTDFLEFAAIEDMVFAGWDVQGTSLYDSAIHHNVLPQNQLDQIKDELSAMKPWPAVFSGEYAANVKGDNIVKVKTMRDEVAHIEKTITDFKKEHSLDSVVMVNLASTERYQELQECHKTLAAFEKAIDEGNTAISPAMRYFYTANRTGCPYVNFAPSLTNVPALEEQANELRNPYGGMDGKTGQTLLKTALAAMFRVRNLKVVGWYSVNFLGNNDGLILDNPASNKTKVMSKAAVLDSIVGYRVENHQVHIHYYKPRGDAKEAWDNIDLGGFCGVPMQMKINFLCQDSILAAPLCVDLARICDVAKQKGEKGIQRQLSVFFKSPYHSPTEQPQHDPFQQETMLLDWAEKIAKA